jgi:hypothetical protein
MTLETVKLRDTLFLCNRHDSGIGIERLEIQSY